MGTNKKKKGKGHGRARAGSRKKEEDYEDEECRRQQTEELTAISAIFQDEFRLISEHPFIEYTLTILPYSAARGPDEAHVAVDLTIRYVGGYPYRPPKLRVVALRGLVQAEVHRLHELLFDQAAAIAREGRVCVFNLAEAAQEFLSQHNKSPAASLWDQMQERTLSEIASEDSSRNGSAIPSTSSTIWYDSVDAGLFTDWYAEGEGGNKWAPASHTRRAPVPKPPPSRPPSMTTKGGQKVAEHRKDSVEKLSVEVDEEESSGGEVESPKGGKQGGSVSELLQNVKRGMVRMGQAVKSSMGLRSTSGRWLGPPGGEDTPSTLPSPPRSRASSPSRSDSSTQLIRRDLLLGHLLKLVCSPRGPLPHALPALAAQLQKMGMLPQWAKDLLAHQPSLFNRTFRRMFGSVARDAAVASTTEPSTRWAVSRFWSASPDLEEESGANAAAGSRYMTDFKEVTMLGKGGFGHVVLCINKLDGRRYAVKKVRLRDKSALVTSKILREVATLSRLQHQNVVRYYQAWFETGVGHTFGVGDTDSADLSSRDGWLSESEVSLTKPGGAKRASYTFRLGSFDDEESLTGDKKGENEGGNEAQYLYIQMEYCPKTLRQMLDSQAAFVSKDVSWRMFRQLVEGLVHIHGQGIIHRDLTPSNIFADAQGTIKIGDFGLAKFSNLEQADGEGPPPELPPSASFEGTGQVGTYFYTAPEIEGGWPSIDAKADMYSLGIVLFELWHPFATGMERAVLLNELKTKGSLPEEWKAQHQQVANLVSWLLAPNPADRPSAVEVLRSDWLPPRMEDEALNDVLRAIHSVEDASVYNRVVEAIFDQHRIASQVEAARSAGTMVNLSKPLVSETRPVEEHALRTIKGIFSRHGARPAESRSLDFVDDLNLVHRQAVKILDISGNIMALRYETRLPLARYVAANQVSGMKRYELARVYRKAVGRTTPREFLQGDFDIISSSGLIASRTLAEAECIKVAVEIISELAPLEQLAPLLNPSGLTNHFEVRLNHREVLSAVWAWAGVPVEDRQATAQLLAVMSAGSPRSASRKAAWPLVRRQLLQGLRLSEAVVDKLQAVERRLSGGADEAFARLRGALPQNLKTNEALDELASLLGHLRVWGLDQHVTIDALMTPHDNIYTGTIFQIHLQRNPDAPAPGNAHANLGLQPAACVAVGGRYDGLIRKFWSEGAALTAPGGVGLSIGVQKLIAAAAAGKSTGGTSTEVLVCSRGGARLLAVRMEIAATLWAGHITAEFVGSASPSLTEQYEYAHEHGIKWLVIISEAELAAAGSVKVRHLDVKSEEEIQRDDLVKYFTMVLSDTQSARAAMLRAKNALYGYKRHGVEKGGEKKDEFGDDRGI